VGVGGGWGGGRRVVEGCGSGLVAEDDVGGHEVVAEDLTAAWCALAKLENWG